MIDTTPYGGAEHDDRTSWVKGYIWALEHLGEKSVQTDLALLRTARTIHMDKPLSTRHPA